MSTGRAVLCAAAVAVLVLAVAEASARALKPAFPRAAPAAEPRNPNFVRGWTEYTAPPNPARTPKERLIVAISNSQGFLREREDGRESWPSRLEEELRAGGAPVRVLNWSAPGSSGAEMTILAARALAQQPDLLILVSYNNNVSRYWRQQPLSFHHTDVGLLAYLPEVRRQLAPDFLRELAANDPLEFLGAHSALLWWRNYSWERTGTWTFNAREPDPDELGPEVSIKLATLTELPLLDDFVRVAARGSPPPRVLLVSMPLCRSRCKNWEAVGAFFQRAQELAAADPRVSALDATSVLDESLFYGPRHFSAEGHQIFARWLAPTVGALLAAPR